MGRVRFAPHLRRFAAVPRTPCVYVAELHSPDCVVLKVGMGGNALGRMVSLRSEVKRQHQASIGRFSIFAAPTFKAAYEAETKAVRALCEIATPIDGRREYFTEVSFEDACEATASIGLPCVFIDAFNHQTGDASKGGGVGVFHSKNFARASLSTPINCVEDRCEPTEFSL